MLIEIQSDNQDFSYHIHKNPASPPRLYKMREGFLLGFFDGPQKYCLKFVDGIDKCSFSEDSVDYLDSNRFCNSNILLSAINNVFSKVESTSIDRFQITINALNISERCQQDILRYFGDLNIQLEDYSSWPNYKKVHIVYKGRTDQLLSYLQILAFYISIKNQDIVSLQDEFALKMFKLAAEVDLEYYPRYLLKKHLVKNSKVKFLKVQDLLNKSEKHELDLSPFDNNEARILEVTRNLDPSLPILDFGCGEGRYMTRLGSKYNRYYCYDVDASRLDLCDKKARDRDIKSYVRLDSLPESLEPHQVILAEVLEHIDKSEWASIIKQALDRGAKRIICTTPNKTFNQFYGNIESRREDHLSEVNVSELTSFMKTIGDIELLEIGDSVDKAYTTIGFLLTNY